MPLLRKFRSFLGLKSQKLKEEKLKKTAQALKESEDMLKKRVETLEASIQKEVLTIKENLRSRNRETSHLALERKKMYEQQQHIATGQLSIVQKQLGQLELMQSNATCVKSLKLVDKYMESVDSDTQDVDDLMSRLADHSERLLKIRNITSKPIGTDCTKTKDDLEKELLTLELALGGYEMPSPPTFLPGQMDNLEDPNLMQELDLLGNEEVGDLGDLLPNPPTTPPGPLASEHVDAAQRSSIPLADLELAE